MRPPSRRKRLRRAGHKIRTSSASRLTRKLPALSGELVQSEDRSPSLFQAANLWQFGDWQKLSSYGETGSTRSRQAGKIAMLAASANLQQGATERASQLIARAKKAGCTSKEIARILVAGAHLNLGKANYLIGRPNERHSAHFQAAANSFFGPQSADASTRAIESEQLAQIGVPALWRKPDPSRRKLGRDVDRLIGDLAAAIPSEPAFQVTAAERLQRRGDNPGAIRAWQKAAELMGEGTPQLYYDRLAEAYKTQGSFPQGRIEDEQVRGKIDKYEVLRQLHETLKPSLYLEIGVQSGKSLALARGEAIGVDPMPMVTVQLPKTARVIETTSDDFFAKHASAILKAPPELVLVDGMHIFEYALRDFINVERYSSPHTVVVIDDVFPNSQAQAARKRITKAWAGDIWKLMQVLQQYRPDLKLLALDSHPTGLLLITKLDKQSSVLTEGYSKLVKTYAQEMLVPDEYLKRDAAVQRASSEDIKIFLEKKGK